MLWLWLLLVLACINLLDVCGGILLDHYAGLYCRYYQQYNSQNRQRPGERNQSVGLLLELLSQVLLFFGHSAENINTLNKPIRLSRQFARGLFRLVRNTNI